MCEVVLMILEFITDFFLFPLSSDCVNEKKKRKKKKDKSKDEPEN